MWGQRCSSGAGWGGEDRGEGGVRTCPTLAGAGRECQSREGGRHRRGQCHSPVVTGRSMMRLCPCDWRPLAGASREAHRGRRHLPPKLVPFNRQRQGRRDALPGNPSTAASSTSVVGALAQMREKVKKDRPVFFVTEGNAGNFACLQLVKAALPLPGKMNYVKTGFGKSC